MRSLDRQPRVVAPVLSQVAADEQRAWEIERQQRYAQRPVGSQPHWVDLASPWRR